MSQILNGEFLRNETNENSMGGTERLCIELAKRANELDAELLKDFQIVASRVRDLDESKIRIFWAHDLPGDPESEFLKDPTRRDQFHKYVFVSNWQMQSYMQAYGLPWSKCVVLHNAITPIDEHVKPDTKDGVRLIYTSTPHRGLSILVPVVEELAKKFENIHLDVYSSFKIYGWEQRDKDFQIIFDKIEEHPNMTNHGTVSNDEIRKALTQSHIFAYPSIWAETSCMSLMEAMSAKCVCVHSNYAALYETAANWTNMYQLHEDHNVHAGIFYNVLENAVQNIDQAVSTAKLHPMKIYADTFYNWDYRAFEWMALMKGMKMQVTDTSLPKETFNYKTA